LCAQDLTLIMKLSGGRSKLSSQETSPWISFWESSGAGRKEGFQISNSKASPVPTRYSACLMRPGCALRRISKDRSPSPLISLRRHIMLLSSGMISMSWLLASSTISQTWRRIVRSGSRSSMISRQGQAWLCVSLSRVPQTPRQEYLSRM